MNNSVVNKEVVLSSKAVMSSLMSRWQLEGSGARDLEAVSDLTASLQSEC